MVRSTRNWIVTLVISIRTRWSEQKTDDDHSAFRDISLQENARWYFIQARNIPEVHWRSIIRYPRSGDSNGWHSCRRKWLCRTRCRTRLYRTRLCRTRSVLDKLAKLRLTLNLDECIVAETKLEYLGQGQGLNPVIINVKLVARRKKVMYVQHYFMNQSNIMLRVTSILLFNPIPANRVPSKPIVIWNNIIHTNKNNIFLYICITKKQIYCIMMSHNFPICKALFHFKLNIFSSYRCAISPNCHEMP